MSDDNQNNDLPEDGESRRDTDPLFGLNEPTGQFAELDERMKRESEGQTEDGESVLSKKPTDDLKYKNMGWKGIDAEEEEVDEDPDVIFRKKEPIPEDELDMTPMVDVTFLLLIFFMVTASFTLQKSLEQPHAKSDDPTDIPIDQEEDPLRDYVQVMIDQTNTFYVTTRDEEDVECPSESEMRAKVKGGFEIPNVERLIIIAHVDSLHSKVVTTWDAGVVNNANKIEIQTTEEDY